jgi:thiamine-phosphate pyrophosphorylase
MSGIESPPRRLSGLYVILDPHVAHGRHLEDILRMAMAGGVRLFQYRDKLATMQEAYECARRLRDVAAQGDALFLVNDRCDLAMAVEADGVHLGQDDLPVKLARGIVGRGKLIGVSTHRPDQVVAATEAGADYLGFGPLFSTGTKADHDPVVGLEGLKNVRALTTLPLFAIGGITVAHVDAIKEAGADGVAVISAVCSAPDIENAVQAFTKHWS